MIAGLFIVYFEICGVGKSIIPWHFHMSYCLVVSFPPSSFDRLQYAYCTRSKTGRWEGLETRLTAWYVLRLFTSYNAQIYGNRSTSSTTPEVHSIYKLSGESISTVWPSHFTITCNSIVSS